MSGNDFLGAGLALASSEEGLGCAYRPKATVKVDARVESLSCPRQKKERKCREPDYSAGWGGAGYLSAVAGR